MNWDKIQEKKELWLPTRDYEKYYSISNYGRVYSIRRNKYLSQVKTTNGYLFVMLSKNNKQQTKRVHRLVAEAFIPNPENKCDVNHIDNDRTNNNLENLEWATRSENLRHCVKTTNKIDGGNNYHAGFERWQVIAMRYLWYKKGYEGYKIAKLFDTQEHNVFQVCSYKRYAKIQLEALSKEELSGVLTRLFDEQGIYIKIAMADEYEGGYQDSCILRFYYEILDDRMILIGYDWFEGKSDDTLHKTRTEAEEKAFEQAFKILENKL